MGGGQANSGQASTAAAQQTAASNQDMALSQQNADLQKRLTGMLFGSGKPGAPGGSLSGMMDPASLTQSSFNPAYKSQWNQAQDQIGKDASQARGSLAQSFANSGAGTRSTPSGFQADQMNQINRGEADTRGATFSGLMGNQYKDALNNFWNANNIASGNAASSGNTATGAAGNSGTSSAQLYGTAGAYHPSQFGSVLGSALGAGGQIGAAAMTGGASSAAACPAEGSLIRMGDNSAKLIEHIRKGDFVMGIDGKPDEVLHNPEPIFQSVVEVIFLKRKILVSQTHTLQRTEGGYTFAGNCLQERIETDDGPSQVIEVRGRMDKCFCRHLFLKRSHGYNVDGVWSFE